MKEYPMMHPVITVDKYPIAHLQLRTVGTYNRTNIHDDFVGVAFPDFGLDAEDNATTRTTTIATEQR